MYRHGQPNPDSSPDKVDHTFQFLNDRFTNLDNIGVTFKENKNTYASIQDLTVFTYLSICCTHLVNSLYFEIPGLDNILV